MRQLSSLKFPRPHGGAGHGELALRAASSYYLPEGRYYAAPLVLKRKRQSRHVMPVVLGAGLSAVTFSTARHDAVPIDAQNMTVLSRSNMSADSAGVDLMTTASTSVQNHYAARPVTAQSDGYKKGILDPNPDEARINRADKTDSLAFDPNKHQPDLKRPKLDRVSLDSDHVYFGDSRYARGLQLAKADKTVKKGEKTQLVAGLIAPKKALQKMPVAKELAPLVNNDKPDVLALAYAPTDAGKAMAAPFESIMKEENKNNGRFIPPIGPKDHQWAATPLPASAFSAKEQKCLAEAVYFEARGESVKGQAAVAQVVLNRVRNPAYPKTICGVVYQNTNWRNRCQFSFACDGKRHTISEMPQWKVAQDVAKSVSAGQIWLSEVGSATHYHATYVRPRWARSMEKVDKIGLHIFYRTKNGGWS